jgi:hypothetical protein
MSASDAEGPSGGQLAELAELAEPLLLQTLFTVPSAEVRSQIEALLARLGPLPATPEGLRQRRALLVLEQVGSAAARAHLERLAQGAPGARLTRDARAALDRLRRRDPDR